MKNDLICSKCGKDLIGKKKFNVRSEEMEYFFCKNCIVEATNRLNMKIDKTKEDKELLKKMRKFLKNEKN